MGIAPKIEHTIMVCVIKLTKSVGKKSHQSLPI